LFLRRRFSRQHAVEQRHRHRPVESALFRLPIAHSVERYPPRSKRGDVAASSPTYDRPITLHATDPHGSFSPDGARLKVELLSLGVRIDAAALARRGAKQPRRVRSGSCGGLDLVLSDGTFVNAPVNEAFVASSPYVIVDEDDLVLRNDLTGEHQPVRVLLQPAYYGRTTPDGVPFERIGQLCSDRVGIGLTNGCVYWDSHSDRCRFCSIGLNVRRAGEVRTKPAEQIVDVVDAAFRDPIPARHVLLGGGTPAGPDAGGEAMSAVASVLKERWPDRSIYAMVTPPRDLSTLDRMRDSGVDEIGMNVEVFTDTAAARFTPGKHRDIGLQGYLKALEHAVGVFGPINTRSITVVGLEPADETIRGVRSLASLGVMPILSPFRPLRGTDLEHHPRPRPEELWDLTVAAATAADEYGIPLGPTCIACQSNTLTVPGHSAYRFY
jgi:radical SAM protein (TIGR04043 family)